MTGEHAERRFLQMAAIERAIVGKLAELAAAADHVKELRKDYDGLIGALRAAARDEGELPLFDRLELEGDATIGGMVLEGDDGPALELEGDAGDLLKKAAGRWVLEDE